MNLETITNKLLTRKIKRLILLFMDICLIFVSMVLSKLFLDVIVDIPKEKFLIAVSTVLGAYLFFATKLKVFSLITRYTGYQSIVKIILSLFYAHFIFLILSMILWQIFSYRFIVVSLLLSSISVISPRLIWRAVHETRIKTSHKKAKTLRVLVVGAGDGGNIFINTVIEKKLNFEIVGIVDGDSNKQGTYIRNIKVLGNRNDIPRLVEKLDVDQVTIAIPSLSGREREKLVEICNSVGVHVNNMPSVEDMLTGNMSVNSFQEIDVADL